MSVIVTVCLAHYIFSNSIYRVYECMTARHFCRTLSNIFSQTFFRLNLYLTSFQKYFYFLEISINRQVTKQEVQMIEIITHGNIVYLIDMEACV